jgi:hypothetical protein
MTLKEQIVIILRPVCGDEVAQIYADQIMAVIEPWKQAEMKELEEDIERLRHA